MEGPATVAETVLVQRAARGDTAAFTTLTHRYYRPVASFLLRRVGQADVVEDLAQETFLQAFQSLREGRVPDHFSSWLFGIAHHCWGKWARRKQPRSFSDPHQAEEVVAPSELTLLEEREEAEAQNRRLRESLAELPAETRQMLQLKHGDGKTCEEIAQTLGRPVGTIKSVLARTYKALRVRLGGGNP